MIPDTVMQVTSANVGGIAEDYWISCMPNSVSSAEKSCGVSSDASYSSAIAALSQDESAEFWISVLQILQVFFLGWAPVHHARSAVCLPKRLSCQVLGYVEYQDVAKFSLSQPSTYSMLPEVEVAISTAVDFGGDHHCCINCCVFGISNTTRRTFQSKMSEEGSHGISQAT